VEIMEPIDGLSDKTLDTLSVDILDMQCLEDLKKISICHRGF
jgi:hypothetical protein